MSTQTLKLPLLSATLVALFFGACSLLLPSSADEDEIRTEVDQMPELLPDMRTGIQTMQDSIRYPVSAREAGAEGRVLVAFVVDEEGNVTDPTVAKSVHEALDAEALRVVETLQFKPGQQDGERVEVRMTMPFTFRLPADTTGTSQGQ